MKTRCRLNAHHRNNDGTHRNSEATGAKHANHVFRSDRTQNIVKAETSNATNPTPDAEIAQLRKAHRRLTGMDFRTRKSPRHPGFDYSRPATYSLTVNTSQWRRLFGEIIQGQMHLSDAGRAVESTWLELPLHYPNIVLDRFVVMPDHFHAIVILLAFIHRAPSRTPPILSTPSIINPSKPPAVRAIHESPAQDSSHIHESPAQNIASHRNDHQRRDMMIPLLMGRFKMVSAKLVNELRGTPGARVWHRSYHDRVLYTAADLNRMRRYIADNPRNWRG